MRSCRKPRRALARVTSACALGVGVVVMAAGVCGVGRAAEGRIVVAPQATVAGDVVRLGDVASLEGDGVQGVAGLVLGRAPGAGEARSLDGAGVLEAIRRASGGLDGIVYTIPATIRVLRATQEVDESAVRAIVEEFITEALGAGVADAELRGVDVQGRILLPVGAYRARVIPPPGTAVVGRMRLQVEFTIGDRVVKSVGVGADVALYGEVVMARRPIARGETLGEGDLVVERRDLSDAPRGALRAPEDVLGRVARTALTPYAPIRREQIEPATVVHRGDVVLLVAEHGALRITAAGEAREDAALGEQVRVVNRATQKNLVGKVVDASTVGVEF